VLKDFDKWVGIKGKSTVLYNVIDDSFFVNEPKKNFRSNGLRMVAVGNLRWQKNYPYLLKAFETMPDNVSLDIYGDGDLRREFQNQIDAKGLNVRLCGHRIDMPLILRDYDLFVMSSLYEGFSLGLMEAMASGLPALLSDVPVLREAGGDCAVYFDLENPRDLVEKTLRFIENPELLQKYSDKARMRATIAKKEDHVSKLIELYDQRD
jgi:glycosyltransferase involved in cell wall biosynthesis